MAPSSPRGERKSESISLFRVFVCNRFFWFGAIATLILLGGAVYLFQAARVPSASWTSGLPKSGSPPALPWPPPPPSTQVVLAHTVLFRATSGGTLHDADVVLTSALDAAGYSDRSYFSVPGGFAIVTRIEQTQSDGTPMQPPARWSMKSLEPNPFDIVAQLKLFVTAPPGYFQIWAFVVTDEPFPADGRPLGRNAMMKLLYSGDNRLPAQFAQSAVSASTQCTVLVYEFVKPRAEKDAQLVSLPGRMPAKVHLMKASLWEPLGGNP